MFAAILRRWRLVTPLALAVLAVAIVTSGVLASASAHTVHFHFWGRAAVLVDESIVLPDTACDTGPQVSLDGSQIDVVGGTANFGCVPTLVGGVGGSSTNGQNEIGTDLTGNPFAPGIVASITTGQSSVKTDNTKKEGHTISQATAVGLTVGECFQVNAGDDCDADDPGTQVTLLTAVELQTTAEAECELGHSGHVHASARATTSEVFNDLFVLEGFHTANGVPGGTPILAHLSPGNQDNLSYPIINLVTVFGVMAEQLTFNEVRTFQDGGISWVKATGVHIIITNFNGTVVLNLSIDKVFAAIHCEKHLPNDDAIGA